MHTSSKSIFKRGAMRSDVEFLMARLRTSEDPDGAQTGEPEIECPASAETWRRPWRLLASTVAWWKLNMVLRCMQWRRGAVVGDARSCAQGYDGAVAHWKMWSPGYAGTETRSR